MSIEIAGTADTTQQGQQTAPSAPNAAMPPVPLNAAAPGVRLVASVLVVAMLAFYWIIATIFHLHYLQPSDAAHFIAQAQSLLDGKLDVTNAVDHDYVTVAGKWYIVYPPMPMLLMLPFVAVLGKHFSDVWFTWLAGAANVALLYATLEGMVRRGWSRRDWRENVLIALVFGVGTIAFWLALGGRVWFTAQTIALTGIFVMLLGAVTQRWWLASLGVAAAFLSRSPDVLGVVFLAVLFARDHGVGLPNASTNGPPWRRVTWRPERWPTLGSWVGLTVPLLAAFVIFAVRDQLFFGSFLESGYALQVKQNYPHIQYGLLSWRYIWPNFVVDFVNMPTFAFATPFDTRPKIDLLVRGNGTSIFFTTPLFLLFFTAGRSRQRWVSTTAWICVALLVGFSLLWNGTGWYQVGARYLFDAYPFLFVLLALREGRITWRWLTLAGAGVVVNLMLAETFWCDSGNCLTGLSPSHKLGFVACILAVPIVTVLAWWWLGPPEQTAPRQSLLESPHVPAA